MNSMSCLYKIYVGSIFCWDYKTRAKSSFLQKERKNIYRQNKICKKNRRKEIVEKKLLIKKIRLKEFIEKKIFNRKKFAKKKIRQKK